MISVVARYHADVNKQPGFVVAAVVLRDDLGRVLTVRKRGTHRFMLPGGKIEPGETSDQTAVREIAEETGLDLPIAELEFLGTFHNEAANEPGHLLKSHVYVYPTPIAAATPHREIAEVRWIDPYDPGVPLAPQLEFNVLPLLKAHPIDVGKPDPGTPNDQDRR